MIISNIEIKKIISKAYPYLSDKEMELFMSISKYSIIKNKKLIFKGGRLNKNVFFILKGNVRIYNVKEDGVELVKHLRSEGTVCGDTNVFTEKIQTSNIEAIGDTHVLKFSVDDLEKLGFNNHEMMVFYLNLLKEILLVFSYRIDSFVSMTPKERYLDLIKWNPSYLDSTFDKHVASFLGITPLTLYRIKKSIQ
jgi:CRP-like cAMP-binding protein